MTTKTLLETALYQLYLRWWRECGYRAERFRQMIEPTCKRYRGGKAAARSVLTKGLTGGFLALKDHNRLDLSVEQLILDAKWKDEFSDGDRRLANDKLAAARS